MKKLIASIAALVVALGSAFAQDLAAVTEIYNAGAAAVSTDKESALKSFEQALQLATALGEEGQEVVANCKNIIPNLKLSIAKDLVKAQKFDDAIAKLQRGQFIMIRDGTAARNLEALIPLLCDKYVERCMFCTDDKHPNDLLEKGHIDYIVKKAISLGVDPIIAIKAACHNAARYFLLNNRGAIAPGYLDIAVPLLIHAAADA